MKKDKKKGVPPVPPKAKKTGGLLLPEQSGQIVIGLADSSIPVIAEVGDKRSADDNAKKIAPKKRKVEGQ